MTDDYQPISCSHHDRLEAAAVIGRGCELIYRTDAGENTTATVRIVDVSAHDGAEFLTTDAGARIRLDRIVALDGFPFTTT